MKKEQIKKVSVNGQKAKIIATQKLAEVPGASKLKHAKENVPFTDEEVMRMVKIARACLVTVSYDPAKENMSFIERQPVGIAFHNIVKEPNGKFHVIIKKSNERILLERWEKMYRNPLDFMMDLQDDFINDEALIKGAKR